MRKLVLTILIAIISIFNAEDIYAQYKKPVGSLNIAEAGNSGNEEQNKSQKRNYQTPTARRAMDQRIGMLAKELNLDEKQSAEVRILLQNHFTKAATIKAKHKEKETFGERLQLKAARMEFHSELKEILNKDQRRKLKDFREKRKTEKKTLVEKR
ncbi:MAG: hypothetical protein ACXWEY_13175 [Bacteroidia bacterium]